MVISLSLTAPNCFRVYAGMPVVQPSTAILNGRHTHTARVA